MYIKLGRHKEVAEMICMKNYQKNNNAISLCFNHYTLSIL